MRASQTHAFPPSAFPPSTGRRASAPKSLDKLLWNLSCYGFTEENKINVSALPRLNMSIATQDTRGDGIFCIFNIFNIFYRFYISKNS
jgi:hypothetical protein